ncbi:MAG TPA: M23 family metallopeptidase, partial [Longimicrobiales bacterium]|nr:M23 family metallopeptidase [Longimicrobiales bacterium]
DRVKTEGAPVVDPAPVDPAPVDRAPVDRATVVKPTSSASLATGDQLSVLSAQLDVPVQGVSRADLHDTFNEMRGGRIHEALDILAARGTPVLSATDGRLLKLFDSKRGGLMVYATDVSENFILLYGHLDGYAAGLTEGAMLKRGQVLGYVGTTGNAPPETPHLHFGILRGDPAKSWSKGSPVNPYPLLVGSPR